MLLRCSAEKRIAFTAFISPFGALVCFSAKRGLGWALLFPTHLSSLRKGERFLKRFLYFKSKRRQETKGGLFFSGGALDNASIRTIFFSAKTMNFQVSLFNVLLTSQQL